MHLSADARDVIFEFEHVLLVDGILALDGAKQLRFDQPDAIRITIHEGGRKIFMWLRSRERDGVQCQLKTIVTPSS